MGTNVKSLWNKTDYDDVSNSNRANEICPFAKTPILFTVLTLIAARSPLKANQSIIRCISGGRFFGGWTKICFV